MNKIHKLSPSLADMIAAGEVVERPASVVKELVENSVDAGANKITVEIQNGGVTFIRVADDGCGISREDAPTAFLRHATSKISSPEDLGHISTMGFRGEALAAISAVSKIDLLTRAEGEELGVSLRVEAGNVLEVQPAGCPQGTTMIVRELFYNTPARMKFLKRDSVEGSYISGAVQRQALGHPEIAFQFIRDGKLEFSTPGDGKLMSAIYAVLGRASAREMVEVRSSASGVTLTGFVGKPTASRGSRSYQHFFVNGRYVKSKMMAAALEEAYKNQIMVGRFPICVLHVTVAPTAVDVNVHPAKTEVKFLREGDVFDAIHYGVLGALSKADAKPEMKLSTPRPQAQPKADFYQRVSPQEYKAMAELLESGKSAKPSQSILKQFQSYQEKKAAQASVHDGVSMQPAPSEVRDSAPVIPVPSQEAMRNWVSQAAPQQPCPVEPEPAEEPLPPTEQISMAMPKPAVPKAPAHIDSHSPEAQLPYRIIGQALDTYIIVEQGDGLLLFDKHAAHERILFEKLKAQDHPIMSQVLLAPLDPKLTEEESAILLEHSRTMERLGFSLTGTAKQLTVQAVPCDVDQDDAPACLSELAAKLMGGSQLDGSAVYDELLHTVACKAAIKGGQKSDPQELSALVAELMSREDIKYCPHGRPVCISLSRRTLEREFKRA